ncbi:MAG: alkane 1-monooxygenase [Candidatus Kapabacteria bacterium]|nr:alkane 1-monooxygenase [Candidatus Kapabacteria bacterium]
MTNASVTSPLTYYVALSLPLVAWVGLEYGHGLTSLGTIFAFLGLPMLDMLLGKDERSPSAQDVAELDDTWSYRLILYLYAIIQTLMLWRTFQIWSVADWTWWEFALSVISIGTVTGGLGITIAHELGHRNAAWERSIGYLLLVQVGYVHFAKEHVAGHHRNVGLRSDPATARKGESVYAFIGRCIVQSWLHVWQMEAQRLRNRGKLAYGVGNRMWWWMLLTPALAIGVGNLFGSTVGWLFVGQGVFAFVLLEAVNYVEHYGLVRKEIRPGVVEKFGPQHAWEARYAVSNAFLFKLQRHADHHLQPQRRYQSLKVHDESPQLPQGYPAMVLLALIPPLWRRVVHPRIPQTQAP